MDQYYRSVHRLRTFIGFLLIQQISFTVGSCTCCLRTRTVCNCAQLRFDHHPKDCGDGLENATKALLGKPILFVSDPANLSDELHSVLILDTHVLGHPKMWSHAYIVFAASNLNKTCLKQPTGCHVQPEYKPRIIPCEGENARYGPLRVILIQQKTTVTNNVWKQFAQRIFPYSYLYENPFFMKSPIRMTEYPTLYCRHAEKFDIFLYTSFKEEERYGCNLEQPSPDQVKSVFTSHFPLLVVRQADVNQDLKICHIHEDWTSKPVRPRSESKMFGKVCSFDILTWVSIMMTSENASTFVGFMKQRTNDWFTLTQLEVMHLETILNSSRLYEPVLTDDGHPHYESSYDVHPYFCQAFLKQLEKARRTATRGEAYLQILRFLKVEWNPNLNYYRTD
ncbi:uncharacterized protein DEA37_0010498 [Paragonimus westermani]|uniref:Uncharacterized protein n=1 Tax=Paragonimus westermani TaxID=34504 RepID=A0A5J4NY69_9TREM|nr:uncharacterized protein DEA37_0010498 [Paragonimus westermani]